MALRASTTTTTTTRKRNCVVGNWSVDETS
jgi:hypothetical protein